MEPDQPLDQSDLDALSRKVQVNDPAMKDLERLFKATFELPEWLFIARGEIPDITPYVAAKQDVADGRLMIRAFTDAERLHRFAAENGLLEADGQALMLSIKTANVIEYLEQFEAQGVDGVWFNSDVQSDGYFTPLRQLRPIKEHLQSLPSK